MTILQMFKKNFNKLWEMLFSPTLMSTHRVILNSMEVNKLRIMKTRIHALHNKVKYNLRRLSQ